MAAIIKTIHLRGYQDSAGSPGTQENTLKCYCWDDGSVSFQLSDGGAGSSKGVFIRDRKARLLIQYLMDDEVKLLALPEVTT